MHFLVHDRVFLQLISQPLGCRGPQGIERLVTLVLMSPLGTLLLREADPGPDLGMGQRGTQEPHKGGPQTRISYSLRATRRQRLACLNPEALTGAPQCRLLCILLKSIGRRGLLALA